jgi:hypothetical protein
VTVAALIAVYHDEATAQKVARKLEVVAPPDADVGTDSDNPGLHHVALESEMDAEVSDAWASPGIGVFLTGEQMRGAILIAMLGVVVGAVCGLPIGLVLFDATSSVWVRLGVGALVGTLFGATVAALIGGGLAMQSPATAPAAQRGYVVSVSPSNAAAERVMAAAHPIRLDRVVDGQRVATPHTEGPSGVRESIEQLEANSADPRRQG